MQTNSRLYYIPPESEVPYFVFFDIFCASPENGGLEDIGYEDWTE